MRQDAERTAEVSVSELKTGSNEPLLAAAVAAEAVAHKAKPDFIGSYQILSPIAQGGMAEVFLARPPGAAGAHRQVAVKRLRPDLAGDERFVSMFLDELQIASRIQHPNVCAVMDFGVTGGEAFLAMEYLMGETLASVRRKLSQELTSGSKAGISLKERTAFVCHVIAEACEGLHAAHEQMEPDGTPLEIVHRDVSPENLLVTFDGSVKVLDFGVARARCQTHTTQAGDVKGKFAYMAPEILDGKPATRRTDVWGLGVILWEMLTLKRLFRQESDAQTLQAVMRMSIEPPSMHQPGIPSGLDAIVMAALQRDPDKRIASAREFGQALCTFLARRRLAANGAETADVMQRLFPNGAVEKRKQLHAAISGKPISVATAHDHLHSHGGSRSSRRATIGAVRTRATKIIRAFRRKPWGLALVSGVTGAGLWWVLADGRTSLQGGSVAEAAAAPATSETVASENLKNELQMAQLLRAAGARIDVVESTDNSIIVRIKVGQPPVSMATATASTLDVAVP